MFTRFMLGNFKAFADLQNVPVRPLTLIFGANSSGKSSLMHGLLLARHAAETGRFDVSLLGSGNDTIDLGGFEQYAFAGRTDLGVRIGLELPFKEVPWDLRKVSPPLQRVCLDLAVGFLSTPGLTQGCPPPVGIRQLAIALDGVEFLRFSHRVLVQNEFTEPSRNYSRSPDSPYEYRLDALNTRHRVAPVFIMEAAATHSRSTPLSKGHFAFAGKVIDGLLPRLAFRRLGLLPVYPGISKTAAEETRPLDQDQRRIIGNLNDNLPRKLANLMEQTERAFESALGRLQYLGPLRTLPERHVAMVNPDARSVADEAWIRLRDDPNLRSRVNKWLTDLHTRHQVQVRELTPGERVREIVSSAVTERMEAVLNELRRAGGDSCSISEVEEQFGIEWDNLTREALNSALQSGQVRSYPQLLLEDMLNRAEVSVRDVGVGISQVLPVLVAACSAERGLLAIEQPEIHLHPALQAELGDVFIESALGGTKNTFILETHSEHLILRILRRIRECSAGSKTSTGQVVKPEDVAVLFVQPGPKGSEVIELPVTPDGDFAKPWPGGFFAERLSDLP